MARFGLTFSLPEPEKPDDVNARRINVRANGGDAVVFNLPGMARVSDEVEFNQDDTFSVTVQDADATGNWTPESAALDGTVNDDVAPATPGAPGLAGKRQL